MGVNKNILIVAGEKSGEEHLMDFFLQLKNKLQDYSYWGVAGDEAQKHGLEIMYHLKDFSSMGFSDVIGRLPFYFYAMEKILLEVERRKTEAAILVDFQGFNLKLAKKLTKLGVKVFYYVAPQAWVWRPGRAKSVAEYVDHLFCILPFEKKWFQDRGVINVSSVLHPVYRKVKIFESSSEVSKIRDEILILPGSRNSEVLRVLPVFLKSIKSQNPKEKISIVKTGSVDRKLYDAFNDHFDVEYESNELYTALSRAKFCLAASGTVTLSCALMGVPTIVGYKLSLVNELFFRLFVPYKGYICLANLIAKEELFPELMQDRFNCYEIEKCLKEWMQNPNSLDKIRKKLGSMKDRFNKNCVDATDIICREL